MNQYQISIIYTGSIPIENLDSEDMPYVVSGDILTSFNLEERNKTEAYFKAMNVWSEITPELKVFQKMDEEILFLCSEVGREQ